MGRLTLSSRSVHCWARRVAEARGHASDRLRASRGPEASDQETGAAQGASRALARPEANGLASGETH